MRADPTFSAGDLIRIWTENLTTREQDDVRCFFLVVEKGVRGGSTGLNLLLRILALVFPKAETIFKLAADIVEGLADAHTAAECLQRLRVKPEKEVR